VKRLLALLGWRFTEQSELDAREENEETRKEARQSLALAREVLHKKADKEVQDEFSMAEDEMRNGRRR
jgi:hypothetical protein